MNTRSSDATRTAVAIMLAVASQLHGLAAPAAAAAAARKPNIVYIMADELGYYELSHMGNPNLRTPNIDRMAAEGIRFTQALAGSSVCAPTRCCFLTGKHSGHTSVRANDGGTPLRAGEATVASILKPLGYATGGFGKWGNGGRGSTGVPEKQGFDLFVGYYDQVHAHSYYTPYLVRNSAELPLAGNRGGSDGTNYAHYAIVREALTFIRTNKDRPFFCYLPFTPPHGLFDIPDNDPAWAPYKDRPWPEPARRYAAMVSMLDRQIGDLFALLKDLGLDERTLVFFSGDNGGADYFRSKEDPRGVHVANKDPRTGVEFRGHKGNLYEGGLRIPFIARWPGKIAPGRVSDLLCYFPDVLPTLAEVAGAQVPADIDGISILPELIGETAAGRKQGQHEYLYWEIGGQTAVRAGSWKAVQSREKAPWELYDLKADVSETRDLAKERADVLARLKGFATAAHAPVVPGTYTRTDLHQRDRAAKFGLETKEKSPAAGGDRPAVSCLPGELPKTGWKIARVSSENVGNGKLAANAIDGDPGTVWHTRFADNLAQPPHELVIDLGAERVVRGFCYLPRQDPAWNGAIKELEFGIGASPDGFADPVAKATLPRSKESQLIECPATKGRYILLRALSEQGGGPWASAAEVGVIGE